MRSSWYESYELELETTMNVTTHPRANSYLNYKESLLSHVQTVYFSKNCPSGLYQVYSHYAGVFNKFTPPSVDQMTSFKMADEISRILAALTSSHKICIKFKFIELLVSGVAERFA